MKHCWITLLALLFLTTCTGGPSTDHSDFIQRKRDQIEVTSLSNGTPVIYQEIPETPITTLKMVFSGSPILPIEGKEGLTAWTLALMTRGTENRTYQEIQSILYRTSASISPSGGSPESASLTLSSLNQYFHEVLTLFQEIVLSPGWNAEEARRLKQDFLMGRQQQENQPYPRTGLLASEAFFGEHPYGAPGGGTRESLPDLTREDSRQLHQNLLSQGNRFFVVSGSLPLKEILPNLEAAFGSLPSPEETPAELIPSRFPGAGETIIREAYPASPGLAYMVGYFPLPPITHEDRPALNLAFSIWKDLLFEILRTRNSLCYSTGCSLGGGQAGYGKLIVYKTDRPAQALTLIEEARQALLAGKAVSLQISTHQALTGSPEGEPQPKKEAAPLVTIEKVLDFYKQQYITQFYQNLGSTGAQASQTGTSWLYWQDPARYLNQVEEIRNITPEDLKAVINRWLDPLPATWVVLGDPALVAEQQ